MSTPTLINLPPPPSNPGTPSDMGPGTPNSTTTSLSALSTTAIKDGHQGHMAGHGHQHTSSSGSHSSTNTLDAERADRISRLAGLERVATVRAAGGSANLAGGTTPTQSGYFDGNNPPIKEKSTVGSASATGSVGGRTTWASGSDVYEADNIDKMSEDPDDGTSSVDALSEEGNASLVGFGEGASSTMSGPVSTAGQRALGRMSGQPSPTVGRGNPTGSYIQQQGYGTAQTGRANPDSKADPKMIDGMTYDSGVLDTVMRSPPPAQSAQGRHSGVNASGAEVAEHIMRDRLDEGEQSKPPMGSPADDRDGGRGLGKFYFEEK